VPRLRGNDGSAYFESIGFRSPSWHPSAPPSGMIRRARISLGCRCRCRHDFRDGKFDYPAAGESVSDEIFREKCLATKQNGRHGSKRRPLMKRWTNHAITLLLLSALIVAGISVYYTRQEWREMCMRVVKHR